MTPYRSIDNLHYGRLFRPSHRPATFDQWIRLISTFTTLVNEMQDDGSRPPGRDIGIEAGYTYFGQFIDHDLTNDATSLGDVIALDAVKGASFAPEGILNRQTPYLDLSHLYGKGPLDPSSQVLYEDGDARLRVGTPAHSTVTRRGPRDCSFDVALGPDLRPLLADRRASENIIIRQITAVFARLHNLAVEQWRDDATNVSDLFDRARIQTTWQFQWLVVNDYLATVLHPEVYQSAFVRREPWFEWQAPQVFCIPIEFSVAAMRFGHSMVRDAYVLSDETDADLETLLRIGLTGGPLDAKFEIDWARFFQGAGPGGQATTAQPIDTFISKGMFRIPLGTLQLFNSADVPFSVSISGLDPIINLRLPLISLIRGAAMSLPSGQEVAEVFGVARLSELQLTRDTDGKVTPQGQILLDHGLTKSTPLWYYILRESEVKENGSHLGRTASYIVAETIAGALRHDTNSYLNHSEATQMPPTWRLNSQETQFFSLSALFEAAADF
jgi:hypothetical protein